MSSIVPNTETLIKEAARRVFTAKGLAATRTEDIATEAGVNKALVNYYYRTKDRLFEAVFQEEMQEMTQNMSRVLSNPEMSIFEKIRQLVECDFEMLLKNPGLPLFVLSEIARNPFLAGECIHHLPKKEVFESFSKQIETEVARGTIRAVDPQMLWMNLMSLVTMPFVAKPWIIQFFQLDEAGYFNLMQERRQHVADFIIESIRPNQEFAKY